MYVSVLQYQVLFTCFLALFVYARVYVCVFMSLCIRDVRILVCGYVNVYVYMCVCMYVCMCGLETGTSKRRQKYDTKF
jgi:hypothetical protein